MRLTVYNGSPRGKAGNTFIMLGKVLEGFTSVAEPELNYIFLASPKERLEAHKAFSESDLVLLGFPLYTDAMPGLVKEFIESLSPYVGQPHNPKMAFLVQSGFPEAHHSRFVERYLEKLARRLNAPYAGTIVKGGCEGVRLVSDKVNGNLFEGLRELGVSLAQDGHFDPEKLETFARPERFPCFIAPLFKVGLRLPATQSLWVSLLKKNGVYEDRNAKPFKD